MLEYFGHHIVGHNAIPSLFVILAFPKKEESWLLCRYPHHNSPSVVSYWSAISFYFCLAFVHLGQLLIFFYLILLFLPTHVFSFKQIDLEPTFEMPVGLLFLLGFVDICGFSNCLEDTLTFLFEFLGKENGG